MKNYPKELRTCVISYANGKYINGLRRMEESIKRVGYSGDILFWYDELPPDSPTHEESPCGFKIFAFLEAKRRGYDLALWLDATGIVIRPLDPIFAQIEKEGYFLFSPFSAPVGEWSADSTLKNLGVSREQAMHIPELLTFIIGLNLHDKVANAFLEEYRLKAIDGITFRGAPKDIPLQHTLNNENKCISKDDRVHGHRWEQTVASLISHQLNMKVSICGIFDLIGQARNGYQYANYIPLDTAIVQNRDIRQDEYIPALDKFLNKKHIAERIQIVLTSLLRGIGSRIKTLTRILRKGYAQRLSRVTFYY